MKCICREPLRTNSSLLPFTVSLLLFLPNISHAQTVDYSKAFPPTPTGVENSIGGFSNTRATTMVPYAEAMKILKARKTPPIIDPSSFLPAPRAQSDSTLLSSLPKTGFPPPPPELIKAKEKPPVIEPRPVSSARQMGAALKPLVDDNGQTDGQNEREAQ